MTNIIYDESGASSGASSLTCDRCGEPCTEGYQHITYGKPESATGYQDEECVCGECLDKEALDDLEELRYEKGDMDYDMRVEDEL